MKIQKIFKWVSLGFCLSVFLPAFAQKKVKVDSIRPIRIDYKAPSWNKNKTLVDTAILIVRDANSGKMARIEMHETGPNTGIFEGYFKLNFISSLDQDVSPEIYVAPQKLLKPGEPLNKVETLIKDGTLMRKPFFLRSAKAGGTQLLSVYDNRKQAYDAYESYMKVGDKNLVDKGAFEAEEMAKKEAEERRLADLAKKAELEKMRLEDIERKRQEELRKKQESLNAAEREKRKLQAKKLAAEAMEFYRKEETKKAEEKFNQSIELDPTNSQYYFQYGVTLYKNEKYAKSLAALSLAEGSQVNPVEKSYFMALNHMKLQDFTSAYKEFLDVKAKDQQVLGASAAFFAGVIDFQKENYDKAKENMEFTLDHSKDPRMDEQAEAMIEQIANIKQFLENKKKKWVLGANLGLTYDSNILNQSASNSPTDLAGYRWAYGLSAEYRLMFEQAYEWSAILSVNDMYSTDNKFAAKSEFQNTDPLMMSFTLPYKFRSKMFEKPVQSTITPGYETINMNADATGSREMIVYSYYLKGDQTYVMNDDWFSVYGLEFRQDNSMIDASDEENQTAMKATLSTTNMFFRDKKKSEAYIVEFNIADNIAKGDNQTYMKYDLAGSYMFPILKDSTFNGRLGVSYSDYNKSSTGRKDTNTTLTLSVRKPLTEKIASTTGLTYMDNNSNVETSKYNKYSLNVGLSWSDAF